LIATAFADCTLGLLKLPLAETTTAVYPLISPLISKSVGKRLIAEVPSYLFDKGVDEANCTEEELIDPKDPESAPADNTGVLIKESTGALR
jgi:hypothetical protein